MLQKPAHSMHLSLLHLNFEGLSSTIAILLYFAMYQLDNQSKYLVDNTIEKPYCQNPNLTTTQPQPNLNLGWVWHDYHFTPPTHPPTPQELYFYQK